MELRLAHWRTERGMTLEQVAERMGTDHTTVSRWERGHRKVSAGTLIKLAEIYNVHPGELFFPPPRSNQPMVQKVADEIPDDSLDLWLEMGRALAKKRA